MANLNNPRPGTHLYFFALAEKKDKNSSFICSGYVIGPVAASPQMCKLIVDSVMPISILSGYQPKMAASLLGRKIARPYKDLFPEIPKHWLTLVSNHHGDDSWMRSDQQTQAYINNYLRLKGLRR